MYFTNPSSTDGTFLRQGDILMGVPFFGTVDFVQGVLSYQKGLSSSEPNYQFHTSEISPCMVISACCEMARNNAGKSNTVILAPWRPISRGGRPEDQERLKRPVLDQIAQAANFRFVWCEAFPDVGLQEGLFDLSALFSASRGSQDLLLAKRVKSATDGYRTYIKQKIAIFFTRDQ
jgi:hypothetical protein